VVAGSSGAKNTQGRTIHLERQCLLELLSLGLFEEVNNAKKIKKAAAGIKEVVLDDDNA
jgi:hypothetical protein